MILPVFSADSTACSEFQVSRQYLWNGNIGMMVTAIPSISSYAGGGNPIVPDIRGGAYKYDQLNRLKEARSFFNIDINDNEWDAGGGPPNDAFYENFAYDAT